MTKSPFVQEQMGGIMMRINHGFDEYIKRIQLLALGKNWLGDKSPPRSGKRSMRACRRI